MSYGMKLLRELRRGLNDPYASDGSSLFAPVHTIFPVLKISVHVLGAFRRKANPGNTCGLYSTSGKSLVTSLRSMGWLTPAEATTFSIEMSGVVFGIQIGSSFVDLTYKDERRGILLTNLPGSQRAVFWMVG